MWEVQRRYIGWCFQKHAWKWCPRLPLTPLSGELLLSCWPRMEWVWVAALVHTPAVCKGPFSTRLHQHLFCCILEDSHLTLTSLIYGVHIFTSHNDSSEITLRFFTAFFKKNYYLIYMYVSMWMYGDYVLLVLMKARRHETRTWSPRYLWVSPGGYRDQTSSSLEEQ